MNYTDEQIIKALECCSKDDCGNCPNTFGNCYSNLAKDAFALIKQLAEENERLRAELRDEIAKGEMCAEVIKRQDKEKEIMHESFVKLEALYKIECKRVDTIKADTVREMQERLKEKLKHYPQRCGDCFKEKVDQIAKEMLEGEG